MTASRDQTDDALSDLEISGDADMSGGMGSEAARLIGMGQGHLDKGKPHFAEPFFTAAVGVDPSNQVAQAGLAECKRLLEAPAVVSGSTSSSVKKPSLRVVTNVENDEWGEATEISMGASDFAENYQDEASVNQPPPATPPPGTSGTMPAQQAPVGYPAGGMPVHTPYPAANPSGGIPVQTPNPMYQTPVPGQMMPPPGTMPTGQYQIPQPYVTPPPGMMLTPTGHLTPVPPHNLANFQGYHAPPQPATQSNKLMIGLAAGVLVVGLAIGWFVIGGSDDGKTATTEVAKGAEGSAAETDSQAKTAAEQAAAVAAADKAAADKAAADKAAADKAAADKAAADKVAADKVAADNENATATEAADKEAADKEAADKEAADKEAADKRAADKSNTKKPVKRQAVPVKSPGSGVVSKVFVTSGKRVKKGDRLFEVSQPAKVDPKTKALAKKVADLEKMAKSNPDLKPFLVQAQKKLAASKSSAGKSSVARASRTGVAELQVRKGAKVKSGQLLGRIK